MSDLYDKLAEAYGRPSGAYRAATAALDVPNQGLEGYLKGTEIGDKLKARKLQGQTLAEALGGNIPAGLEGFGNTTIGAATALEKPITAIAALDKARRESMPDMKDYLTPDQAKAYGASDSVINSFNGRPIPRQVVAGDVSNKQRSRIAGSLETRNELNISNAINKNVNALTGTGALGQSGKNNLRISRIKPLLEKMGPLTPQELERVNTDIDGVITGGVPLRSTEEGQKISTIASQIALLKQQFGNRPETFNDADFRRRMIPLVNGLIEADNEVQGKALNMVKANFGHLTTPEHLQRIQEAISNGQQLPIADVSGPDLSGMSEEALRAIASGGGE